MGRDIGQNYSPPAGAIEISFPRSDGHASRRPERPPQTREINHFRLVAHNEPANVRWRCEVATRMAKHVVSLDSSKSYVFKSWPEGYALFDHEKGATKESARHDLYLFGSQIVFRFRSVNEFVPHAIWLYSQSANEPCACRYCSKAKGQSEITQQFNLPSHTKGADTAPVLIRRVTKPFLVPAPEQRVHPQRDADLRAVARATRKFRIGEVVWCGIDPPIVGVKSIDWWPAIIREVRLKSILTSRQRPTAPTPARSEYSVKQSSVYKVQLLGVRHFHIVPESMMLPYLAWFPSTDLFEHMKSIDGCYNGDLSPDLRELTTFYPMPSGSYIPADQPISLSDDQSPPSLPPRQGSFRDATAPFAYAVQISAYISQYWSLSDEWEFKPKIPKPVLSHLLEPGAASSSSAAAAATASNADAGKPSARAPSEYRYQGIWWGCERIWQDDLVRIQPYRDQIELDELLAPSETAETRSLFLLLSAVFIGQSGDTFKGKIAGPLFELAPEGWMDPVRSPSKLPASPRQVPEQPLSAPLPLVLDTESPVSTPTPYALPPPPHGFVFRQITPPGFEIVLDIAMLAGRYYYGLFDTPPGLQRLQQLGIESAAAGDITGPAAEAIEPVLCLSGLAPSYRGMMQSTEWKKSRLEQLNEADETARADIYQHDADTRNAATQAPKEEEEDPLMLRSVPASASGAAMNGLRADDPMVID